MKQNKQTIEELFKSKLENFEVEVPSNIWNGINKKIPSKSLSKLVGGTLGGKYFIIAVSSILSFSVATILYVEKSKTVEENTITEKSIVLNRKLDNINYNNSNNNIDNDIDIERNISTSNSSVIDLNESAELKENISKPKDVKNHTEKEINNLKEENINQEKLMVKTQTSNIDLTLYPKSFQNEDDLETKTSVEDVNKTHKKTENHTSEEPNEYNSSLSAKDKNIGEDTEIIHKKPSSKINNIPNIFSPNNDGVNDCFLIQYENIEDFNLYIYTKKGKLIFYTEDIKQGWNGIDKHNREVPVGEYLFIIKAKGTDGKKIEEKGVVKLVR